MNSSSDLRFLLGVPFTWVCMFFAFLADVVSGHQIDLDFNGGIDGDTDE